MRRTFGYASAAPSGALAIRSETARARLRVVKWFGVLAFAALFVGTAHASVTPDDPACVGKFRGEICQLADRSGGVCATARCGAGDRPCLRCAPVPAEIDGKDGDLWVPMLSFGMLVTIIGSIFWFRLKRNWDKKSPD